MTLCVKPISAFLSRDTEVFSNMDPYVVAIVGAQKQRTATHNEGGKKPRWNDELIFRPKASSMLVTVYDEDTFSDDVVGSANIELKKFIDNPTEQEENVNLSYKGKNSGTLKLKIKYTPQQKQLWNNQKGIVYPNNPYNMGTQPNYNNPGVRVPPINNNTWQVQPNYGNPNNNSWGAQGAPNVNNNANWNNQLNQSATNLLLANHIANVTTGQQPQGGLNEGGIWGNILDATLQNQQQMNPYGNPYTTNNNNNANGWGSQNNGWGSQNNGWGSQNNGWGSQNNGWGSQNNIYKK